MESVKFADLIQLATGSEGRLGVCYMYASQLSFRVVGNSVLVWVAGDDASKQVILDIEQECKDQNRSIKKYLQPIKSNIHKQLEARGLTHSPRKV